MKRKSQKYTEEKVLYFADCEGMLHVSPLEKKNRTTLYGFVSDLLKRQMLSCIQSDESGSFYSTTTKGSIHLVKLQIRWREENGKDVIAHKDRLNSLQLEYAETFQ